ncbi:MAG: mannose-1-phosphate guanylyltransferase [Candidatus Omnitrophica bacterium]|nr:mannose-1-phosphate guanylyltransferase [Candidatus Omnitrophota bacterium]
MKMKHSLYAVLLAGGKGTRLWPLSTDGQSKSFIRFAGRKALMQAVLERIKAVASRRRTVVVIDNAKTPLLKEFLQGIPKRNILIEPFGRNTAAAVGLAAIKLKAEDIMLVLPVDQFLEDVRDFEKTVGEGMRFIEKEPDKLLCLCTKPAYASESFGYVKIRSKVQGKVFSIDKFIEKPSLKVALKLIKKPNFLWNSGMFMFKAKTILNAMKKHAPLLYKNLQTINKTPSSIKGAYSRIKSISLDYQVMEKAKNVYCLKGQFRWHDIGKWTSLEKVLSSKGKKKDISGNICIGKTATLDVYDSLIYNTGSKTIGAIGLKDIIVVNTENGVLVCKKNEAERVRELVRRIKP